MTREEILNMPAGEEMDDLILVKVFGYRKEIISNEVGFMQSKPAYKYFLGDKPFCRSGRLPKFSTDIAMAYQVVEKFENRCMMNNVHGVWECYLPDGEGKAKTAPLAICRAALLAVMK